MMQPLLVGRLIIECVICLTFPFRRQLDSGLPSRAIPIHRGRENAKSGVADIQVGKVR